MMQPNAIQSKQLTTVYPLVLLLLCSLPLFGQEPGRRRIPVVESQGDIGSQYVTSDSSREGQRELLPKDAIRQVASGLAIVLGVFTLWIAINRKRQVSSGVSSALENLGTVMLTPKIPLHMVRVGNRILVLHVSGNSVNRVAEIDNPAEVHSLLGEGNHKAKEHPRVEELLQNVDSFSPASHRGDVR